MTHSDYQKRRSQLLDKIADYLPEECASLNHNDLPETAQAIDQLIIDMLGEQKPIPGTVEPSAAYRDYKEGWDDCEDSLREIVRPS